MRIFGKLSIALLCMALFAALASAKIIDSTFYEIPKTLVATVIDGKQDAVWKTLDWNFQNCYLNGITVPDSWADLFGASKFMWDDQNLYGLFYTQDDEIVDSHANFWERDGIEVYTDGDNSKTYGYDGVNDIHLSFRHEFINDPIGNLPNIGWPPFFKTDGVEFAILDDTTMGGFWLEFKIPLQNLFISPVAGTLIGLALQQNDNDGPNREHISWWWRNTLCGGEDGIGPQEWGTAILSSRTVDDKLEIKKTPIAPVIDGVMDDIYAYGNPITANSFGNGNFYPVDFHDNFVRLYMLYDNANLYGFYDVYDDVIVDQHANSWERDGVEIYTDADNSKGERYDGVNDQHFVFRHEGPPADPIIIWPPQPGEFKVVDDSLGYDIEFRVALEDLGMPPEEGRVIGLEIQQNDNDGPNLESISKWWLEQGNDSWMRPNTFGTAYLGSLITTGVEEKEAPVANHFSLAQNYPNPFNPSTKISYILNSNGKVRLSVYDLTGREVAVLVNGVQDAGEHTVVFSGAGLASGIYFCKLQAAEQVITKKMALVR